MKAKIICAISALVASLACLNAAEDMFKPAQKTSLRAPAYPLVTVDPYTSAWSFSDTLNGDTVRHWTGKEHPLTGALRVDGKIYRFIGGVENNYKTIIPMAASERWNAAYTESAPEGNWTSLSYNDSSWKHGKAAFGSRDMPYISTEWTGHDKDIWVRRTFELPEDLAGKNIELVYSHDDVFELYINGIKVVDTGLTWKNNVVLKLPEDVLSTLKKGKNIIAAYCHNTTGGSYIDFGLREIDDTVAGLEYAAVQKSASVLPTQTYYTFECGPVELDIVFTAPLLLDNLDLASRPVNYMSYRVKSKDGKAHDVQIYVGLSSLWAVNSPDQPTVAEVEETQNGIMSIKVGSIDQPILEKAGDDLRIDWGYAYLAAKENKNAAMNFGASSNLIKTFLQTGSVAGAGNDIDAFDHQVIAV